MDFYWIIIIAVVESMVTLFIAGKYAVQLKHSYDEDYKPSFFLNEPEVLVTGFFYGAIGLILSYIFFSQIRKDDAFNRRRYLLLSFLFLAIQGALTYTLFHFGLLN